jgi:hypothetical protein
MIIVGIIHTSYMFRFCKKVAHFFDTFADIDERL